MGFVLCFESDRRIRGLGGFISGPQVGKSFCLRSVGEELLPLLLGILVQQQWDKNVTQQMECVVSSAA